MLRFLYELFNIGTHKANAHKIDSSEAMIAPDGTVEYAMPSHQEFLVNKSAKIKGMTDKNLKTVAQKNIMVIICIGL